MRKAAATRIMVAIESIDRSALPLLRKAALLARQRRATLQLLHVIAFPYGPVARAGSSVRTALKQTLDQCERGLTELASSAELRGLRVRTIAAWDFPASDAIIRQVVKHRPSLLLAESRQHSRVARAMLTNTDWDLIRNCPCPVLLSKSARIKPHPIVVAALDPLHVHAKPANLDATILKAAVAVAGSVERVYAFHAFAIPQPLMIDGFSVAYWTKPWPEDIAAMDTQARKALEKQAQRFGVEPSHVSHVRGEVEFALPRFAKRKRADIVVMGAISRHGLRRLLIGSTAEKVIDDLHCDVLIVKPRGFTTPVPQRPTALIPYPPYPLEA